AHDLQNKNHGSRLLGQCGCGVIFFQKADAVATKASSSRLRVPPMLCLSICGTRDNRRYVRAGGAPAKTAPNRGRHRYQSIVASFAVSARGPQGLVSEA